jgi:hypothetical protein
VGVAAADNFLLDKTIRVFLAVQEPHKAVAAKAKAAVTEPVVVVVVVAKTVEPAVVQPVVTAVLILEKMATVWLLAAALYQLAATEEYPMVQATRAALLSAIIPKSF